MKQGDCNLVASYIDPEDANNVEFIWGIKAADDLSDSPACLYSMNDIDLIYIKSSKMYELGIETIYYFDTVEDEKLYLEGLLDEFTKFMIKNGYETEEKPSMLSLFSYGMKFVSIPQAYATFRKMVEIYNS